MASPRVLASVLVAALGLAQVSAVEVYTPNELSVRNGTKVRLPCTFTSTEVISSAASVTWSFGAQGAPSIVSFFYYSNGKAYPGKDAPFKGRISWAGDLYKNDASISIADIQFQDIGTYVCDVKNPPDTVVTPGEIRLRVEERDPAFMSPHFHAVNTLARPKNTSCTSSGSFTCSPSSVIYNFKCQQCPSTAYMGQTGHDYSNRSIICLAVGTVILVLLVFIVITDHLFWKEQRSKVLKPLANTENNQRFPSDCSRTTRLLYENVRL